MIAILLQNIFKFPQYNPREVVVPMPMDCRVQIDRNALIREYEALKPQGLNVNRQGKNEVFKQTDSGFDMEIIGDAATSITAKTGAVQRVPFLTDYDKIFVVMAKLDPLKAARIKAKWATIRHGKYLTNKIIAFEMNEKGMGERNVATYTSALAQALAVEQKEKRVGER